MRRIRKATGESFPDLDKVSPHLGKVSPSTGSKFLVTLIRKYDLEACFYVLDFELSRVIKDGSSVCNFHHTLSFVHLFLRDGWEKKSGQNNMVEREMVDD